MERGQHLGANGELRKWREKKPANLIRSPRKSQLSGLKLWNGRTPANSSTIVKTAAAIGRRSFSFYFKDKKDENSNHIEREKGV